MDPKLAEHEKPKRRKWTCFMKNEPTKLYKRKIVAISVCSIANNPIQIKIAPLSLNRALPVPKRKRKKVFTWKMCTPAFRTGKIGKNSETFQLKSFCPKTIRTLGPIKTNEKIKQNERFVLPTKSGMEIVFGVHWGELIKWFLLFYAVFSSVNWLDTRRNVLDL